MIELKFTPKLYSIVLVGCGGTGSHLLRYICQLLMNKDYNENIIKIVDQDIIEDKNLLNQNFLKCHVGRSKAEVLCKNYGAIAAANEADLKISFLDEYIKDINRLREILWYNYNYTPILISCVDNNSIRAIFHDFFMKDWCHNLIYIDTGNGSDEIIGQTVVGLKVNNEIILPPAGSVFPEILKDNDDIDKVLSCSYHTEEAPQNIAANLLAAVTAFFILNNIIAFDKIENHISYFDASKPEIISR